MFYHSMHITQWCTSQLMLFPSCCSNMYTHGFSEQHNKEVEYKYRLMYVFNDLINDFHTIF